jgi:hypothetical protein
MTVLVEILVAHTMPGSVELMSSAIDALTRVFHAHSSQSDANYLMQLLMSMLESIASSITVSARFILHSLCYLLTILGHRYTASKHCQNGNISRALTWWVPKTHSYFKRKVDKFGFSGRQPADIQPDASPYRKPGAFGPRLCHAECDARFHLYGL